jgi:tRNA U55 pseudouridine synthase TruB
MKSLVREAVGPFRREDALSLDALAEVGAAALLPMEQALDLPTIAVSSGDAARLSQGQAVEALLPSATVGPVALLHGERLRALACLEDGMYRPFKVFVSLSGEETVRR